MAEAPAAGTRRDLQHVSSVVLGAVVVAAVAAWVAAEVAGPVVVFPAVAGMAGVLLDRRAGDRAKLVFVGYAVAAVLAASPVLFFLPDVLVGRTSVLAQVMTVVLTRVLLLVGAVVAYAAYRVDGGRGVLERTRDPDARLALAGYGLAVVLLALPLLAFLLELTVGTDLLVLPDALGWRVVGLLAAVVAVVVRRREGGAAAAGESDG